MKGLRSMVRRLRPLLALACLAAPGCSGFLSGLGVGMPQELQQRGVAAPAEILALWDTGWTINDDPVIGMKVRVEPADRPAFEATIEKTAISRLAIPQFQPGQTLLVRFDPESPSTVAVDFDGPAPAPRASSGNPYQDRYQSTTNLGASFLPPPDSPRLYLGTGDSAADVQALYENDYALLGGAGVEHAPDPRQALDQGRKIGAALVVVYGRFDPAPGLELEVLPFRRRPAAPGASAASIPASLAAMAPVSGLGPDGQAALYWGKTRPAVLGIVSRPLDAREQADLQRQDGILIEGVAIGSPADRAGLLAGDVVVAIDGQPLEDFRGVPALITSLAGRTVRIDLIRGGSPLAVTAHLNPVSP
jgi:hypothetical protein